ncbi:MAG: class I SAM-dependent methyltransferase [Thermoplasmata archaeon]|nr:class I SAM-dependent methyltransferase [Thermoplasmata archaeon]MCI4338235.1 class I SAM-dependent methyltransferase [Thermoplasmata archaeon]MCI4341621.1 class I SAM-dependent methyltransferase [Thermoplasmata archaeon]
MSEALTRRFEDRYREQDYRNLPWFSPRPPVWVANAVRRRRVARGRSLDLGCGAGTLVLWLARTGYAAVGLDAAPSAIAAANGRRPAHGRRPRFEVGSVLRLPFPAQSFDLVTDIGLLHTLTPRERQRYAAQLARVLRPGGDYLLMAFAREEQRRRVGPPYRLSVGDVVDLLEPSLEVVSVETMGGAPAPAPRMNAFHLRRRLRAQPRGRALW